jgi:hypothetical protein
VSADRLPAVNRSNISPGNANRLKKEHEIFMCVPPPANLLWGCYHKLAPLFNTRPPGGKDITVVQTEEKTLFLKRL